MRFTSLHTKKSSIRNSTKTKAKENENYEFSPLFDSLSKADREEVNDYTDLVKTDLSDVTPISIDSWCDKSGIPASCLTRVACL